MYISIYEAFINLSSPANQSIHIRATISCTKSREESIKLPYTASNLIASSPIASVLTPLKGVSKQDRHLYNDFNT